MKPRIALLLGILLTITTAALWHGPVGNAGARIVSETETVARINLEYFEMEEITPFMERDPLVRRLWLTGEADDFQRRELARILKGIETIEDVQWVQPGVRTVRGEPLLPLIVEAELLGLAGFGLGLILGYALVRLRRRQRDPNRYI
ncbi:hypothetical protein [Sphingomicrobium sediminis]|uniref:Uncharacterized protein n=1 Tax=Sphingomicrobium sediminis TaxID=2950949 RepID=A0A9X2EGZ8_9SPHN|nr:hypothetical protein [Sphingomicrobium sediminis]MCM8557835.1 hypothetical protein [Sphingomicrobium sediminis]